MTVAAHIRELARLINRGSFHGEAIVLSCGGTDNVATCDKLLEISEQRGLIERGNYDPTRQQQFFNVNGDQQLSHHHWITKTTTWLDEHTLAALLS